MTEPNPQQRVIDEFRANGGVVGGYHATMSLLLLHTIGARSGRPRLTPLTYVADGDRYVVFAAGGGTDRQPDWYHNLLARPEVTVEVGKETFPATATVVTGAERDTLYQRFYAEQPQLADYQARTTREIPAVVFTRAAPR